VPEVVDHISIDLEVISLVGFMFLFGGEKAQRPLGLEVGGDQGAADHIIEHLFVDPEDGRSGVAEGDDEVEDVSGVVVGNGLLEVKLVRVEFFYVIPLVSEFIDNLFNYLTRLIYPTNIGY
jgi:hypothetical protein